jgi:agmatinase
MESVFKPTLQPFLDSTTRFEESRCALFGAPFDSTSSYRRGSRFAPDAIRQASQYMETYSPRTGLDLGDIALSDLGNVRVADSVEGTLEMIEAAVKLTRGGGVMPLMLGGEHTVTLGALRALRPGLVVVLDAHMDLRDRLLGSALSHGTYLRRALEELDCRAVILGARALSREEKELAESNGDRVRVVAARSLLADGAVAGVGPVREWLEGSGSAYLSIDMDVLDPSQAPAVGNPAPEGIGVPLLLDLVCGVVDERFLGFDLTEVSPHYDSGLTAIQAAHIALETLYCLERGGVAA